MTDADIWPYCWWTVKVWNDTLKLGPASFAVWGFPGGRRYVDIWWLGRLLFSTFDYPKDR